MTLEENKDYQKNICQIGNGHQCCKYLVLGSKGFECMRDDPANKKVIDSAWLITKHVAQGDNCKGYNTEKSLNQFEHQIDSESGRYLCNTKQPMPENRPSTGLKWIHPDAIEIAEDYGKGGGVADGDFVKYKCPHCLHEWWIELPN